MENLTPGIIASHNTAGKQHSENTHKIQNPVPRQSRVRKSIGKTRCDAEAKKSTKNSHYNCHQIRMPNGFP